MFHQSLDDTIKNQAHNQGESLFFEGWGACTKALLHSNM
jgi:hypothetical protein